MVFGMLRRDGRGRRMPPRRAGFARVRAFVMGLSSPAGGSYRLAGQVVGVALLVGVACAGVTSAAWAKASKPMLSLTGSLTNYNPAMDGTNDIYGVSLVYSALIHVNTNGSYGPELATSWRYLGKHNETFQLTLRKGVRFTDGTPLTARGVAAWLNYFYFKSNSSSSVFLGSVSSIKATGKLTVQIRDSKPNPELPRALSDQLISGYIASPKCAADLALFQSHPCGSGEYKVNFSQSVPGSQWSFSPNAKFYDPADIKFSKVQIRLIADPTTALQAMQTGQINVITLIDSSGALAGPAQKAGFAVYSHDPTFQMTLALDVPGSVATPLANLKVRQAINYALDRKAIGEIYGGAFASGTDELLSTDGQDPKYYTYYSYNPGKARALLDAAGYPHGFTLNNVIDTTFDPAFAQVAATVAQNLGNVGITINYNTATTLPAYLQAVQTGSTAPMIVGVDGTGSMWSQYTTVITTSANPWHWTDPKLAALFIAGENASTPAKAAKDWQAITDRMVTQAYFAPLFDTQSPMFANKHIKGISMSPTHPISLPTEWSIS
jgi:peptide/nickel transport system substrate-binding protein